MDVGWGDEAFVDVGCEQAEGAFVALDAEMEGVEGAFGGLPSLEASGVHICCSAAIGLLSAAKSRAFAIPSATDAIDDDELSRQITTDLQNAAAAASPPLRDEAPAPVLTPGEEALKALFEKIDRNRREAVRDGLRGVQNRGPRTSAEDPPTDESSGHSSAAE